MKFIHQWKFSTHPPPFTIRQIHLLFSSQAQDFDATHVENMVLCIWFDVLISWKCSSNKVSVLSVRRVQNDFTRTLRYFLFIIDHQWKLADDEALIYVRTMHKFDFSFNVLLLPNSLTIFLNYANVQKIPPLYFIWFPP